MSFDSHKPTTSLHPSPEHTSPHSPAAVARSGKGSSHLGVVGRCDHDADGGRQGLGAERGQEPHAEHDVVQELGPGAEPGGAVLQGQPRGPGVPGRARPQGLTVHPWRRDSRPR